jgi:hypothetical protein
MKMGMATLQWSADIAIPEEKDKEKKTNCRIFIFSIRYLFGHKFIYDTTHVDYDKIIGCRT